MAVRAGVGMGYEGRTGMTKTKLFSLISGLILLTAGIGLLVGKPFGLRHTAARETAKSGAGYACIDPILNIMKKDVKLEMEQQGVTDIALYYQDLKTGVWVAINKDEKFNLASLIKVPIMIQCLESVESHPELIKQKLTFTSVRDWNVQQNIKPPTALERGKAYTLEDTMFRMVAYSDNNAMQMLLQEFPANDTFQFLRDHKIEYEQAPDGIKMSLASYVWFFESLYDNSLLNEKMSQKALSYLAAENFPEGMHAAVPPGVVVESKFGEKLLLAQDGSVASTQLHEVGIIQNGDRPFLIGIMTSGSSLANLEKVIRDVTRDVFEATKAIPALVPNKENCLHASCHS